MPQARRTPKALPQIMAKQPRLEESRESHPSLCDGKDDAPVTRHASGTLYTRPKMIAEHSHRTQTLTRIERLRIQQVATSVDVIGHRGGHARRIARHDLNVTRTLQVSLTDELIDSHYGILQNDDGQDMEKKRRRHKMSDTMQRHASLRATHESKQDGITHAIRLTPRHHTRQKSPRNDEPYAGMPRNAKLRHTTKVPDARDTKAHGSANAQKQHTSLRRMPMTARGSQETRPEGITRIPTIYM